MRYFNFLLLLRILNVFLLLSIIIRCIFDFYHLESFRGFFSSKNSSNEDKKDILYWNDINIMQPPSLNDTLAEALRLNELIARSQFMCTNFMYIGNNENGFNLCNDDQFKEGRNIREILYISAKKSDDYNYMRSLDVEKWTAFIPEGFIGLDELRNTDIELHYFLDLNINQMILLSDIVKKISNRQFDIAFIDLFKSVLQDNARDSYQLIEISFFLERILEILESKQLHIVIEINDDPKVIFTWYSLLYRLFFNYNYAIIGAEASGSCARMIKSCTYRLSFVKSDFDSMEPPSFGFGSPLEERKRLIRYLTTSTVDNSECIEMNNSDLILICTNLYRNLNNCSTIYVRYEELSSLAIFKAFGSCDIVSFSPLLSNKRLMPEPSYPYGLSPDNQSMTIPGTNLEHNWRLISFAGLLRLVNQAEIDALVLDMNGGEWDIFDALLQSKELLSIVRQISLKLRLWIGEENECYRRFYSYFLRLEMRNFRKQAFRVINDTTYLIVLVNNSFL